MSAITNAELVEGYCCAACGWRVVWLLCAFDKRARDPFDGDSAYYCSNPTCEHHAGEDGFQHIPDWMRKATEAERDELKRKAEAEAVHRITEATRALMWSARDCGDRLENAVRETEGWGFRSERGNDLRAVERLRAAIKALESDE